MAVITGVSSVGVVVATSQAPPLNFVVSIAITNQPLPPQKRIGYYWLYVFQNAAPNQCFLIDRAPIYKPGIYKEVKLVNVSSAFSLLIQAVFDEPGNSYVIQIT